jgi:hypothetical protein
MNRLCEWFDEHSPSFELSTQPSYIAQLHPTSRCLRARTALPAGAAVLTVPKSVCLNATHFNVSQCAHVVAMRSATWFDSDSSTVNLALLLLIERLKGEESFFAPFVNALVQALQFDDVNTAEHPAFWREDERAWLGHSQSPSLDDELAANVRNALKPSMLDAQLATRDAVLRKVWRLHVRPFLIERALLSGDDDQIGLFFWSMYTVWSRGYWVHGEPTLVPIADLFNHGGRGLAQFGSMSDLCESGALSDSDVERVSRSDPAELSAADRAFFVDGAFRVLTWRALEADDEILISYGSLNREMLSDYGFVMETPLDLELVQDEAERAPHLRAARFSHVSVPLCLQLIDNGDNRSVWFDAEDEDENETVVDRAANETWSLACEMQLPDNLMRVLRWAFWRGDDEFARRRLQERRILSLENELAALMHLDRVLATMLTVFPALDDAKRGVRVEENACRVRRERWANARRVRGGERALVKHWRHLVRERWMSFIDN